MQVSTGATSVAATVINTVAVAVNTAPAMVFEPGLVIPAPEGASGPYPFPPGIYISESTVEPTKTENVVISWARSSAPAEVSALDLEEDKGILHRIFKPFHATHMAPVSTFLTITTPAVEPNQASTMESEIGHPSATDLLGSPSGESLLSINGATPKQPEQPIARPRLYKQHFTDPENVSGSETSQQVKSTLIARGSANGCILIADSNSWKCISQDDQAEAYAIKSTPSSDTPAPQMIAAAASLLSAQATVPTALVADLAPFVENVEEVNILDADVVISDSSPDIDGEDGLH
jgi:hypothetical protein